MDVIKLDIETLTKTIEQIETDNQLDLEKVNDIRQFYRDSLIMTGSNGLVSDQQEEQRQTEEIISRVQANDQRKEELTQQRSDKEAELRRVQCYIDDLQVKIVCEKQTTEELSVSNHRELSDIEHEMARNL